MPSLLIERPPRRSLEETPLEALMTRAREAWERAGRPGALAQLRLGQPVCCVCGDLGCEHCPAVTP